MKRLLVLALLASAAHAQDDLVRVEVTVTAVAGSSVYLDAGRDAGLEPGDVVRITPAGAPTFAAVIGSVSKSSSRAALEVGSPPVRPGDPGEVLVPSSRLVPAADPRPEGEPSAQLPRSELPWEAELEDWDDSRPLLAPTLGRPAAERSMDVHGRLYTTLDATWDSERDQRVNLFRDGGSVVVTNPLRMGGELALDGELFRREAELTDTLDVVDNRARLDRLSYRWGGDRDRATRVEVGRFLQHEFPELGVLDGVELSRRTEDGSRRGASVGFQPDPLSDFRTGDDLQAALYWASPLEGRALTWGVAYQNTWHRGDQDRNLVVSNAEYRPFERLRLRAETWVDWYGHGDVIKSRGLELTEVRLDARLAVSDDAGLGARLSRVRWPELLREEFATLTPEQIRRNRSSRATLDGWRRLSRTFRVDGRVSAWEDQDDDGASGDLRLSARDVLGRGGGVAAAVFATAGAFSSNRGLRLTADKVVAPVFLQAVYELTRFEQDGFAGALEELDQHRARLQLDFPWGAWSLSLYVETLFGDEQDSFGSGLFLQYRF